MAHNSYMAEDDDAPAVKRTNRRRKCLIFGGVGVAVLVAAVVIIVYFATKPKNIVSEKRKEETPAVQSIIANSAISSNSSSTIKANGRLAIIQNLHSNGSKVFSAQFFNFKVESGGSCQMLKLGFHENESSKQPVAKVSVLITNKNAINFNLKLPVAYSPTYTYAEIVCSSSSGTETIGAINFEGSNGQGSQGSGSGAKNPSNPGKLGLLKKGTFQKLAANVAGAMEIHSEIGKDGKFKKFLFFKGVVLPAAPDLFLYLTPEALPKDVASPGTLRVLLDGTDSAGHFAKAGDFRQNLKDDFDETKFNGATIWCKRFAKNYANLKLEKV